MKNSIVKLLFLCLVATLIGNVSNPVFAELDTTKIGVNAGDKKTWEYTELNIPNELFGSSSEDEIKKGDKLV